MELIMSQLYFRHIILENRGREQIAQECLYSQNNNEVSFQFCLHEVINPFEIKGQILMALLLGLDPVGTGELDVTRAHSIPQYSSNDSCGFISFPRAWGYG